MLVVLAGGLAYSNYSQSGPAVAFEDLPSLTQQRFTIAMSAGDTSWRVAAKYPPLLDAAR